MGINGDTMGLIWELIIAKAQDFINKACQFDFNWNDFSKELDDKTIGIHMTQIDCAVYATITRGQIVLSTHTHEPTDLMISASPMTLLELVQSGNPNPSVKIEGNAHLAQTVQKMMHTLNIDWEGFVASYTGDAIAHVIGKIKIRGNNSFLENLGEYVLFETEMAPTQDEVNQFIHDVTQLDYAVERIEARIRLLTEKTTDVIQ